MTTGTRRRSEAGYNTVELMAVLAVTAVLGAMAAPALLSGVGDMALQNDARVLAQTLQDARLKAIQANVTMQVMFNCPFAGGYRVVQLLGTQAVPVGDDTSPGTRCDETLYPYPSRFLTFYSNTRNDGALTRLGKDNHFVGNNPSVGSTNLFQFWPDGTAHRQGGQYPLAQIPGGAAASVSNVAVSNGSRTISITVSGNGKIVNNR